jgi:hypothetical protein
MSLGLFWNPPAAARRWARKIGVRKHIINRYNFRLISAQLTARRLQQANVAELVDALVLGTSGVTRESSSLSFRTNWLGMKANPVLLNIWHWRVNCDQEVK